ncbi:MAG TPA: hypothetical protein VGN57_22915 [Pirellulaceae bacterium]|jgi:hypothetical protein|nr:hypothetical protein [Pirellulaceae bacterium]
MNEWIGRAFRGALSAAALFVALTVYSLVVAPRIDPRSDRPPLDYSRLDAATYVDVTPVGAPATSVSPELFAPGSWELESPKTLRTSHGTLFFREYQIEPTGELAVRPITMIFPLEDATGIRNLVVRAPMGGRLRFTEKIDLAAGKIGKIEGGRLIGEVEMSMAESRPGADDSFRLTTRDVQIDRKLLSTPHEVKIQYGPHWANGRDLAVNFREDGDEGEGFESHEALQHVASLELAHVEQVQIDLDAPGLFGDESAIETANGSPKEPQGKLELRCKKDFTLNLDLRTASFEDQVEVNRLLPDGASDQLVCERLEIEFDEFADPQDPTAKAKLGARRLVALGHPVRAHVRSRELEAQGNSMEYDVRERKLVLQHDSQARLSHQGRLVESPKIVYFLAEGGGLGTGEIAGPGHLHAILGGQTPKPVDLFWTDAARLLKQNDEHVISLIGGARVVVEGGASSASADRVDFWMKELPKEAPAATAPAAGHPGTSSFSSANIQPLRFMAKGRVALDSPQIAVRTPQLEAWFKEIPGVTPVARGDGIAALGSSGDGPQAKRYSLAGDLVRLELLRRGEEWDLSELFIQGAVDFRETLPPEQGSIKPLAVTSAGLHWQRSPEKNETLRIWGDPAQRMPAIVDSESMRLEGPAIDVDRTQSLLQVVGEGRMRLRGKVGSVSPLAEASTPAPAGAEAMQWVTIAWKESLSASGREATFRQDVKTTTDRQFAVSAALVARFDRPIDLMQTEFEAPKLQSLAFEGGITSESRSEVSGELRSIDRFQAQSLQVAPETGQFVAAGPAWISSVRLSTGELGGAPGATPAVGPKSLQYFYVECERGFEGDYLKRSVAFIDRTVALFAPAPRWEVQYRPQDGAALPEKAVTLHCDRLDLRQAPVPGTGPSPLYYLEALASGNARLDSKERSADAQRISFDESKDLIILEGDGRNDVRLETVSATGSKGVINAGKVKVWRKDGKLEFENLSGADYDAGNDPRAGFGK